MRYVICLLLGFCIVNLAPTSARAEGLQQKVVRLTWFPRFSPDGKSLLSVHGSWEASEAGEVRLWNVETGKADQVIEHPRGVRTAAWSPKGNYIVSGDYGGGLRQFDAQTGKLMNEMKLRDGIEELRVAPDDTYLVVSQGSGDILIFALPSFKEVYRFRGQQGNIWGMALSPDGKFLATAGQDKHVRIVEMETLKILHELKHPGDTNGVAFSIDGKRLLTGCNDALIRMFDVETGKQLNVLRGHKFSTVTDLQFSKDGKYLASAGGDKTVRVWDVADLDKPTLKRTLQGHDGMVFGVAISPLGDCLASAGWDDKLILWNVTDGTERWSWER